MDEQKKKAYDKLCAEVGIDKNCYTYAAFLQFLEDRLAGKGFFDEEIAEDFRILDMARLLQQIYGSSELQITANDCKETYSNPALVEFISDTLVAELSKRIRKRRLAQWSPQGDVDLGYHLVFDKYKGEDGRVYSIPYPENETPYAEGFSEAEINMIIKDQTILKNTLRKYKGNSIGDDSFTYNAMLGRICEATTLWLPKEWILDDKYYFLFEIFKIAGLLDFRTPQWRNRARYKNETARIVRNWINAYHHVVKE